MFRQTTIKKLYFIGTVAIILVLTVSLGGFWIRGIHLNFDTQVAQLETQLLKSRSKSLQNDVQKLVEFIVFRRQQTLREARETLRCRVRDAYALAMNVRREHQGRRSDPAIEKAVAGQLAKIRFDSGRGYYFGFTADGREIIAAQPEMAGRQLTKLMTPTEEIPGKSMIGFTTGKEEGFYTYTAPKPGRPDEEVPKLSFIQRFEPFGWHVGSGVYLDEIQRQNQNEILSMVYGMHPAPDREIYVFRYDGTILYHNRTQYIGRDILAMTDAAGHEIYRELLAQCLQSGSGTIRYPAIRPESERIALRICYAQAYAEWQWIIATDMDIDDVQAILAERKSDLARQVNENVVRIFALVAVSIGIVLLLSQYFSKKLAGEFNAFLAFFRDATTSYRTIDQAGLSFLEFRRLAESANRMITDRRQAEQALRSSEEKFRNLFETAPDGISITTLAGEILTCNGAFVRIFKYASADRLLRLNATQLYENPDARVEMIQLLQRQGQIEDYQISFKDNTGKAFTASLSLKMINFESRNCILSILRDVSHIKKMEMDLKHYAENLEHMVAEKTAELRGANAELTNVVKSLEETREQLALSAHQAGMAEIAASILHNIGNAITSVVVRTHTLMGRELVLEIESLERTRAFLQAETGHGVDPAKREKSAKILALFDTSIALLKEKNHTFKADLEFIKKGLDHVAEIIALQQQYAGLRGQEALVDLNQLLGDAVEMLEDSIAGRGIELELDLKSVPPVLLNKNKMIQIFINIIKNAYEAIEAASPQNRKSIRVSTAVGEFHSGQCAQVVVADSGIGIRAEELDKVFRFGYSTKGRRTGFGLHDAANYVNAHGGTLQLMSDGPGKGARALISLPLGLVQK